MDVNFRKIDIDQYDEDVLLDSELCEPDPRDPAQILNDAKQKATAIRGHLSKCDLSSSDLSPDLIKLSFPGETSREHWTWSLQMRRMVQM